MPYDRSTPARETMRLPAPSQELRRALQFADFANAASMSTLESEVTAYARDLRAASASQPLITVTVRALVDDSLSTRVVPVHTGENRARLLALAAEWSAEPVR